MVKDAEAHAEEDKQAARDWCRRATRPTRWCTACRSRSSEYGDKVDADEKDKIEAALKDAEEALKGDDKDDDRGQDRGADDGGAEARRDRCTPTGAGAQQPARRGARRRQARAAAPAKRKDGDENVVDAEFKEVKDKK